MALFSDGTQMTGSKTVDMGRNVDVKFAITSGTWPVTVNQFGMWSESGFALRDVPVARTYDEPGVFDLSVSPPFA